MTALTRGTQRQSSPSPPSQLPANGTVCQAAGGPPVAPCHPPGKSPSLIAALAQGAVTQDGEQACLFLGHAHTQAFFFKRELPEELQNDVISE